MTANKPCTFCQKLNYANALSCQLCRKPFPLPKLTFGTKSECWSKALMWTAGNFLVPPIFMAVTPLVSSYLIALAVWGVFVAIGVSAKYFMNDGELFQVQSQKPQTTGMERYSGIGIEMFLGFVMMPFNRMMWAWEDVSRHYR